MSRLAPRTPSLLPPEWRIELPIFEGPLDLLLHLVELNEVELADIPVARVCDQFHEYLALAEYLNLDLAGEFIYEAAVLIHLKSRMLLPRRDKGEGGRAESDPREELVQRLLEYRRYKEAAQALAEVDVLRRGLWTRRENPADRPAARDESVDLGDVSLFDLMRALRSALQRYEKEHPPPFRLLAESFSVRDQVHRLLGLLDAGRPFDFLHDLRHRSCRAEAIAAFLAVLELARLHLVRIHQADSGDLVLYRTTREVRREDLEVLAS
ncbi:MAG: segregation/condensation protein A [Thermoanaerobaculia bacterium]|nr:segregation/condensation protein A [Thermoanaerobaculia bacterium]